ncbi:hypothetical protein M090_3290 [Parabacteroides distasonis str. 3776 Po2 i]|uniref:Uncharacterized protein n=1 Tax=Parabacteroides distasonis str. 3776 D15 i TaxID=1339342 RepID=A0AB34LC07_PARDI|nr:hypothetical protein M091_0352 [Parabacteroides distasonis str. 3776 D15 i]KDS47699.1 hypothetical protein M090_3290 [Parabacteroides distasonis str. 3776 Po2 i]
MCKVRGIECYPLCFYRHGRAKQPDQTNSHYSFHVFLNFNVK